MDDSQRRRSRGGAIALGLLALPASLLWTGFWLLVGLWEPPHFGGTLRGELFYGAMFAIGVATFLVGVFLLAGRFPGRRGWLVVAVLALLPCIPVVLRGEGSSDRVAAVTRSAERAYEQRRGLDGVAAHCRLQGEAPGLDLWQCSTIRADGVTDSCDVEVSAGSTGGIAASIDSCEGDRRLVDLAVERALADRGEQKGVRVDCSRVARREAAEPWACDLGHFPPESQCLTRISWRGGGASATVTGCERTEKVNAAAGRAYAIHTGRARAKAACYRDSWDGTPEAWECDIGATGEDDHCAFNVTRHRAGLVAVRIRWCTEAPDPE